MTAPEPRAAGSSLNESQQRRLAATCRYVDRLLSDVERILTQSASGSPFAPYVDDLSPAQRGAVADYLRAIREALLRVLVRHGLSPGGRPLSAAHSLRTHLTFIGVAIEELKPTYMRGYGEVAPEAVTELQGLTEELQSIVRRLDDLVARAGLADLHGRLERLERAGADTGVLDTLASIVDARGLVEFRPALGIVLDRLEDLRFELAVFGRVSSGKSSLLNHLLGTTALPVGVTPVTSVPTRLAHGRHAAVHVRFADRRAERLDLDRLADFVTEAHNPANTKRVTAVVVTLPAPLLEGGLVVVDTPGLGSLATTGAAETLAYLPRCDLGLVLIDAAAPLTAEDVGTLERLGQAGIPAHLLLSKADLLAPADLARVKSYVEEEVARRLGHPLAAHPVSVVESHASLVDDWIGRELGPLLREHRQLAQASVRRKIGVLRQAVVATLEARLSRARGAGGRDAPVPPRLETNLRHAAARFEQARLALEPFRVVPDQLLDTALPEAARAVAEGRDAGADAASILARGNTAIASVVSTHFEPVGRELLAVAAEVTEALAHASDALGLAGTPRLDDWKGFLREMPRFDTGGWTAPPDSRWNAVLPRAVRVRLTYDRVHSALADRLAESLRAYALVVHAWATGILGRYRQEFEAQADMIRVQLGARAGTPGAENDSVALERDLERLGAEAPGQPAEGRP